jgi:hypothetical protein
LQKITFDTCIDKNKKIPDDEWIFGKPSQKNIGNFISSDGASVKCDKVFLKYEYVMNIKEIQKKINPVAEELNDDEICEAPVIIELDNHEKFKDDGGNVLDIETRGERKENYVFFKVSDVEKAFNVNRLHNVCINPNSGYEKEFDYKYFSCNSYIKNVSKSSKKIKVETKMFLTYEGILRVLFTTKNNKTKSFRKWATETLFTAHMGTKEQKQNLSSKLLGVDASVIKEVFNTHSKSVSVVYLFTIGSVKDLKKSMKIDDSFDDDSLVCKWGYTKCLNRRTSEHMKTYGKIKGADLKLKHYSYIDLQYMAEAEKSIKDYVNDFNLGLKYEEHVELLILPQKLINQTKDKYEHIGNKFAGHVSELITKIKNLENENTMLQKDIIMEQKNVEAEKQNTRLSEKDNIILQKDKELLELKLEMAMSKIKVKK